MSVHKRRKGIAWLVCLGVVVALAGAAAAHPHHAAAQTEPAAPVYPFARLYPLDKQAFPLVQSYLDVYDPAGAFLHDLKPEAISVIENGQPLAAQTLAEISPGVQFVMAISFGPALGIRDGLGRSRYDYLLEGLASWGDRPPQDPPDDLSLILDGGPETTHQASSNQILEALRRFEVDPRQAVPSLQPLSRAIEVALNPPDRPGMKMAILFITPPQAPEAAAGLQSLSMQAAQAGIRIFIWQVSALEEAETPSARQLALLASQTGGYFFNFTGAEALPDIETSLEPLRFSYQLSYSSAITGSGSYGVTVEVRHSDLVIASPPQTLEITLLPPNPVFVALPSRIEPETTSPDQPPAGTPAGQTPSPQVASKRIQNLEVLIEFPDGYPRQIADSALIVDGAVVERHSEPPFDTFTWDLTPYITSGQHLVQVLVTDTLGLRGESLTLPVEVIVGATEENLVSSLRGRGWWLAGSAALLLGGLAALVFIIGGRLYPYRFTRKFKGSTRLTGLFSRAGQPAMPGQRLPMEKPHPEAMGSASARNGEARAPVAESARPGWFSRITGSQPRHGPQARAFLIPISESDTPTHETPIPLSSHEVILGSDPSQATWVLLDPAIAPVHTRLLIEAEQILVFDGGAVAGTWVNYQLVPPQGCPLRHGDLVHIGCKPYQFKRRDPKDARKPVILSQEQSP
jgi:hypothetical protein